MVGFNDEVILNTKAVVTGGVANPPPSSFAGVANPPPSSLAGVAYPPPSSMAGMVYPPPLSMAGVVYPPPLSMAGVAYPPPLSMAGVVYPPPLSMAGVVYPPPSPTTTPCTSTTTLASVTPLRRSLNSRICLAELIKSFRSTVNLACVRHIPKDLLWSFSLTCVSLKLTPTGILPLYAHTAFSMSPIERRSL